MKAQAIANFIAEMTLLLETFEPPIKEWKVWADGAYRAGGPRIGILLQSQMGIKLWYAIKLAFSTTINVAESEAVIH